MSPLGRSSAALRKRRGFLALLGLHVAGLATIGSARATRAAPAPDDGDHAALVAEAFEQRRRAVEWGDQPFGAVVVRQGTVVGEGPSRVVLHGDPTAHAEMEAIRDASRRLGTRDLSGCALYATSPPCRMCEAAAYWARIGQVYHGSTGTDAGAPRLSPC
jgi:tRNA(Arg) A34 adenosine deaminase TadA